MKILLVHNNYQSPGGEQTAVDAQIALLRQQGHTLLLYLKHNEVIDQYGAAQRVGLLADTVYARTVYEELVALVEQERPDIAHVHNVFPLISPAAYRALHECGVPIVQTVHNFRFLCPNSLFYTQGHLCERCKFGNTLHAVRYRCHRNSLLSSGLYALTIGLHRRQGTFGLIDRFLALSDFAADKLVESGLIPRHKISVVSNFIQEPLPPCGPFDAREPFLLFMGRLSAEKGVAVLLEAMAHLPGVELKLLGDGPERAALEARADELGLASRVSFLGHISGEAKWDFLRRASASVVPSVWYENFPFSVLESLSVGTPVIASRLGSLPHIVREGETGLLFEPGNPQDLAAQAKRFLAEPTQAARLRQSARAVVEQRWVGSAHYSDLMAIYHELIAQRSPSQAAAPLAEVAR